MKLKSYVSLDRAVGIGSVGINLWDGTVWRVTELHQSGEWCMIEPYRLKRPRKALLEVHVRHFTNGFGPIDQLCEGDGQ